MASLISTFFVFFLLIVSIFAVFVIYHLHKFNTNPVFANLQIILFLLVLGALIAVNILAFFELPLDEIVGNSHNTSFP